jgi:hypothetical protein
MSSQAEYATYHPFATVTPSTPAGCLAGWLSGVPVRMDGWLDERSLKGKIPY